MVEDPASAFVEMTNTWEAVKTTSRRLSDSLLHRNTRDVRELNFGDVSAPIHMSIDGIELVYENQMWRLGNWEPLCGL